MEARLTGCRVLEGHRSSDGQLITCASDGYCTGIQKLEQDLQTNPHVSPEIRMSRKQAEDYASRCQQMGCKDIIKLRIVALRFPDGPAL